MKSTVSFPLTIYYDASCPLCANEMHALTTGDANGKLILVDCSSPTFDDSPFAHVGVTRESMLRLIHARDADGRWFKGVDVFEIAYDAAGFVVLARLWGHRWLYPLWDKLYPWIARNRYVLSRVGLPYVFRLLTKNSKRAATAAVAQGCDTKISESAPEVSSHLSIYDAGCAMSARNCVGESAGGAQRRMRWRKQPHPTHRIE